jgi:hypothetical protein
MSNEMSIGGAAAAGEGGVALPAEAESQALALSGSRSVVFADWLSDLVARCQPLPADADGTAFRVAAAMEAMKELAPRNAMEGMLAGQMVAANAVGLALMGRVFRDDQPLKTVEAFLRQGTRAMALYARQMELMTGQRGRQRQSVRIEHERTEGDGRIRVRAEEERVR